MPRLAGHPEQASVIAIRGRDMKASVEFLAYDALCWAHFDSDDYCVGFTVPPEGRPWFQFVGFTVSGEEMQERYKVTKSLSLPSTTVDPHVKAQALVDSLRERPLVPGDVADWWRPGTPRELRDRIARLVAADSKNRGRPNGSIADTFAGYGIGRIPAWCIPRWKHVWRAECLFQYRRRKPCSAEAACRRVATRYPRAGAPAIGEGTLKNVVGRLSLKIPDLL
jgi:hypothetical protein